LIDIYRNGLDSICKYQSTKTNIDNSFELTLKFGMAVC